MLGSIQRQALLKHWNIIDKNVRLKIIFPKPPMIAYSRSENPRDSLVKAKFPTREEGDYSCDDLLRNEAILTNPANTSRSGAWEQRFQHVYRFQDNRGPKYHQALLPPAGDKIIKIMSFSGRYARRNIPDKYRRWSMSWTDQSKGPHSLKHMIMKG